MFDERIDHKTDTFTDYSTVIDTIKPKKRKVEKEEEFDFADFWCGGGGTTTGAEEAIEEYLVKTGKKDRTIVRITGVNHWILAATTYSTNHPNARVYCKAVDSLIPRQLFPKGYLRLLVASPECIGHSKARGGKPTTEQKRADAKDIERWVESLYIEDLILENVEEWLDWGPLGKDGRPLKSKKGEYFKLFVEFLRKTHKVEWRVLCCADYGDATTRRRLFLIARRGKNKKIVFPEPTHASRAELAKGQPDLFSPEKELKPWVSAREIINWKIKGKNIYGRKKDLSPNTIKRIYAGLRKFSGIDVPERKLYKVVSLFDLLSKEKKEKLQKKKVLEFRAEDFAKQLKKQDHLITPDYEQITRDKNGNVVNVIQSPSAEELENLRAEKQLKVDEIYVNASIKFDLRKFNPFLIGVGGAQGQRKPHDIGEPLKTLTGTPTFAVINPYMVNLKGSDRRMRSIDQPTFTQTASPNQQMLIAPSLIKYYGNEEGAHNINEPVPTLTAKDRIGVSEPAFIVSYHSGKSDGGVNRSHSLGEPMPTLDTSNRFAVVSPVLIPCNHGNGDMRAHSINEPVPTITGVDAMGIGEPFLVQLFGGRTAVSVDNPVPTITAQFEHYAAAQPFLVKFNNNQDGRDINEPVDTITTKEKIGIGQPFLLQFLAEHNGQEPIAIDAQKPYWKITPQVKDGLVDPFLVKVEDSRGKVVYGLLLLELGAILIINYRMLETSELARAMSFPPDYVFAGKREDVVRQIGNAVPCKTARALVRSVLEN